MKKITFSLLFLLTLVAASYGQVSYSYGWEPVGLGNWTTNGFSRSTVTPCVGTAAVITNVYSLNANVVLTSPNLGTSNGGLVTLNFDYKVINYSGNTATPSNQVDILVDWSNSASGPWSSAGVIGEVNHTPATTCATVTYNFAATPGTLFIRFKTNYINASDVYYYFDNINVTQGAAPSCVSPSGLTSSNVTSSTATVSWGAVVPTPAAGYEYYSSAVNEAPTVAGTAVTGLSANLTNLIPNTSYYFWVRSMCAGEQSLWYGPFNIRTLCEAIPLPFTETFDTSSETEGCWTVINANGDNFAWDLNYASSPITGNQSAMILTDYNSGANDDWLISPKITLTGNERMKFKYKVQSVNEPNDFMVKLSTTGNLPADFTTVLMPLTSVANIVADNKIISLTDYTGDVFIAFHVPPGGLDGWRLYIDDVLFELSPSVAPACPVDVEVVINEDCGNFATNITWPALDGADGYKVFIGTSHEQNSFVIGDLVVAGGTDVGPALNYSFVGNTSTTYYYVVKAYAGNLLSEGCDVYDFTTQDDGCYCPSAPISNDGNGISSVKINDVTTPVNDVMYANFIQNGAINITQGVNTIMNVTFDTGFADYYATIWIDYNDNFIFEPSEQVFTSISLLPNPYVLNTSFQVPLNAPLGEHRLRIGTTDALQTPPNPCFSGSWGVTLDFLVNVEEAPDCLPPSASTISNITANSAIISWVSEGTTFNVERVFANESQGGGEVVSVTGLTTTLTDLESQTNYAYYLQTVCGPNSVSPWTGPFTFRTGCDSFGDFNEDFATDVTISAPECWYTLKSNPASASSVQVNSFNDYAALATSSDATAQLYLITPSLTDLPLSTHRIKFQASGSAGTSIIVGTMTDPSAASTFSAVQNIQLTSSEFATYAVAFLSPTTAAHVAFKFVGSATYQTVNIDDVVWETAPDCPDIYIVNFDGSTSSSVNISWAPGAAETSWEYAYGLASETDPETLPVAQTGTVSNTNVVINGLAPSTVYKVWVRAACGEGFGNWSPAKTFTTACVGVSTFPWTEGFENITAGFEVFPLCWSKENGDYSTASISSSSYNSPRNGSNYLRNSWDATNEYMWTPGFDLTAGVSYDFSFYMQGDGYTGWDVNVFQNTVQNSTGATQLGGTTTATGSGSLTPQPYMLVSNTIVPATTGTYYFAVRVNQPSISPWYIAFDDFKMEQTPSCAAPQAPTVANVTANSGTINWNATAVAPANGYDYYITSDFAVTPNATTVPTGTVGAGITTANLTALLGSTVYRVYVRSICGTNDFSSWSDAGTLQTDCVIATLPYTINFENVTVPNLPLCTTNQNVGQGNNWKTANAPGYGFTSKVLLVDYAFDMQNAWFFSNTVSLVGGTEYSVSYDYGNNDQDYTESMRVSYGATANATAMTTELANHPVINQATLQSNTVTFTPATSGNYTIGFNVYSEDFQDYLYLDNIVIQVALGASNFDNKSFSAYPNPVKDVLNVSFTQNISDVVVYNLLGQQVLMMNMNANKGQVDMSSLPSGTYLVKVSTENAVQTIKVIKE